MNILAIETSCDETAAAIVADGRRVVAETIASQMEIHAQFGGVVPEVASRRHVESVTAVVSATFAKAGLTWSNIDAIAVTCGPGLLGALLVGVSAAKGYALATGLPLIGVHHIAGHVAASFVETDLAPPLLALVVSGGHTELLAVEPPLTFRKLGGTKDDAAGEAYDKVARLLGLPYPGGPRVDALAAEGDPTAYAFPRSLLEEDSFDFSYSGLKSAVHNELAKRRQRGEEIVAADVCASFQAAVVEVLVDKTARAVRHTGLSTVVVAGGVAANRGLRQALQRRAKEDGFHVHFPPIQLCTDNAAMIGAAAYFYAAAGRAHDLSLNAYATLPLNVWQESFTGGEIGVR
ncbi:tRNA (adenosine(37)-N6)-threonylcarbamoyltransferase complex transferase subunit TsaD [Alicyclobacillus cycloheptanicus]|uniref:tRNA N6-adenosine threonylcarbamoyltransferase n=1 Tax=Alicyclobacillus cycloheptanicus TaxID=1457 RepID=A0ABT9XIB0_9BACL|nr:tRNA (adenosine(37)-N6)-threonylcarbamoyltransferase complex transferase subunit TsaD [Alicyclobacillus cycloheptanicus]MDQ0190058.1 N6-L-threonylcarbamoyladenine synthase [Alicyclobacillus cycloheptanicus]WDM02039.1 tRNA (adenosine(37)-N6)-threonylcarbamoyltransferase complex transferase subunit TsaD [Alicyclobacillus cycloheptanicus]